MFFLSVQSNDSLILNRVRIIKNTAKQTSVRFHGYSPELSLVHTILRFSSPINEHHNALLIEETSLPKYRKIMIDSSSKMVISSRTVKTLLSFHTVNDNTTSDANNDGIADKITELIRSASLFGTGLSAVIAYDGILLLDEYSSIWDHYNVMVFSPSLLSFSYTVNGEFLQAEEEETRYSGVTRFSCDQSFDADSCLVLSPSTGLELNDHLYPSYRLLIDLDKSINLLPVDLYLRWLHADAKILSIKLSNESTLYLNRRFLYDMHQSNLIVLGIDMIHHFPRVSYSVTQKAFQLHYYAYDELENDTEYTMKEVFVFLNLILLACLFKWGTSYNYQILQYMITFTVVARTAHFFAFKQVVYEVLAILVGVTAIVISFLVSEPLDSWTPFHVRKVLFSVSILYNSLILLFILFKHPKVYRACCAHYFARFYRPTKKQLSLQNTKKNRALQQQKLDCLGDFSNRRGGGRKSTLACNKPSSHTAVVCEPIEPVCEEVLPYAECFGDIPDRTLATHLHSAVVKLYHDPIVKISTPIAIARNGTFITIILLGIQLLFNYYTDNNNIYLLVIVALSFGLIYYQVKYIAISIVYLSLFYPGRVSVTQRRANVSFIVYIVVRTITLALGIYASYDSIYVAYFNTVNSTHSTSTINAYIFSVIAALVLLAIMMVMMVFDKYADPLIDNAIESCRRRTH